MPVGFSIIGSIVAFDLFLRWATQGPLGPLVWSYCSLLLFILFFCQQKNSNSMKTTDLELYIIIIFVPNLVNSFWTNYFSVSKTYLAGITWFDRHLWFTTKNHWLSNMVSNDCTIMCICAPNLFCHQNICSGFNR